MTEQELLIAKNALLEIIQDKSQPAKERNHAIDTLLALLEQWESYCWSLGFGPPLQTGAKPGSEAKTNQGKRGHSE